MGLHDLSDVHAVRHTQRIQNDIYWRPIRQERHVFNGQHLRNDALVSVTTSHLVASADLALLCDADTHKLVDTRRQFVASVTREHLHFDNFTAFAMWHTQRSILHFAGLFTED